MKLLVRVIEARNIPAMDPNGFSDPYVKLQLEKQKFSSKVVKKCLNPTWCEDFTFKVKDLKEELVVSVLDEDKYSIDDFIGQIKVPVSHVLDTYEKSLGTTWYSLQPKNNKSKNKDYGDILLTICSSQSSSFIDLHILSDHIPPSRKFADSTNDLPLRSSSIPAEAAVVSKILSGKCSVKMFQELGHYLALLPKSRGDKDSWSLMMQKILLSINVHLNDVFQESKNNEAMRLLIPPRKDAPPPLGGHTIGEVLDQRTKRPERLQMSSVSTFMRCCCTMLTSSYPV